jgi:tetratricopeptide (TPR) repeat protein
MPAPAEKSFFNRVAFKGRLMKFNMFFKLKKWQKSVDLGEKLVAVEPENIRLLADLAESHYQLGKMDRARFYFVKVTELEDEKAEAWGRLSDIFMTTGKETDAIDSLESYLELKPHDLDRSLALKDLYLDRGDYEAALGIMLVLADGYVDRLDLREEIVDLLLRLGDGPRARDALIRMAELEEPPFNRTLVACQKFLEKEDDPSVRWLLVCTHEKLGQNYRAIKELRRLLQSESGSREYREKLVDLYLTERMKEAAADELEALCGEEGENLEYLLKLAEVCRGIGREKRAAGSLRRAKELAPEKGEVAISLGKLLFEQGDLEEAASELDRALVLDHQSSEAHLVREKVRLAMLEGRIQELRNGIARDPGNSSLQLELARSLFDMGDDGDALDALRKAVGREDLAKAVLELAEKLYSRNSAEEDFLLFLTELYMEKARKSDALALLKTYAQSYSPSPEVRLRLGELYLLEGRSQEAAEVCAGLQDSEEPFRDRAIHLASAILDGGSEEPFLHRFLGYARADQKREDEAVRHFRAYLGAKPEDIHARRRQAGLLQELGREEEALKELEKLADDVRDDPSIFVDIGHLRRARDDLEGARSAFARAVDLDAENPPALEGLEGVKSLLLEREVEMLRERIRSEPNPDQARRKLVEVYAVNDREADALEEIRRLQPEGDPKITYYAMRAELAEKRGDREGQLDSLRHHLTAVGPAGEPEDRKDLLYRIGMLERDLGNPEGARDAWVEIFLDDPDYKDIIERLESLKE